MAAESDTRSALTISRRSRNGVVGFTALAVYGYLVFHVAAQTSLYTQNVLLVVAVFIVLALSLDVAAGIAGLYSLGHAALFAIGAYTTAIVSERYGVHQLLLLPLSIVATAVAGAVIGLISLRLSGLYFAITTFVFSLIGVVIINQLKITGSYAGLIGPNFPAWPHALAGLGSPLVWAGGAALVLTVAVVRNLRSSPWYPVLLATRDAQALATSSGARVASTRVAVFVISAALAGVAGWLFAFLGVVSPSQFDWTISVNILVMVIIGGMNTTPGPIVGAMVVMLFNSYVNISPLWQQVIFGTLFVFTITVAPGGIVGVLKSLHARLLGARDLPVGAEATDAAEAAAVRATARPTRAHATAGTSAVLECRGIDYHYTKGDAVLRGVDLTVRPRTIHGLIGPNGSGKSTLINLISGHLAPQAGEIRVNGKEVHGRPASSRARDGLRRTFQTAQLVGELDSIDNVIIGDYTSIAHPALKAPVWNFLPHARRETARLRGHAAGALRALGVGDRWDHVRVDDVPHGIQQLLQLALANVGAPSILLLDEPVAGLTSSEIDRTARILLALRDAGTTIVIVEHHTRFIFDICDDVTVLNAGAIVTSGPAATVRSDAVVREVYLGQ